ncbi:MAG: hypothetical protein VCD00_19555 [Candidatus Hydrogenedentota bacterium]
MKSLPSIFLHRLWCVFVFVTTTISSSLSYASSGICSTSDVYTDSFTINYTTAESDDVFILGIEDNLCFGSGINGDYYDDTGLGPDNVVTFTYVEDSQDVILTLQPDSDDLAIYIVTDCDDVDDSCVWVSDGGVAGETETIVFDAVAGVNYYIIVDGYLGAAGSYQLDLEVQVHGPPEVVYVDLNALQQGDGTQASPNNTLGVGLLNVGVGGIIRFVGHLSATSSNETFTGGSKINARMTLEVNPAASGGVSIGGVVSPDVAPDAAPMAEDTEGTVSGYVTRGER